MGRPGPGALWTFPPSWRISLSGRYRGCLVGYYRISYLISYHLCLEMKQPFRINVAIIGGYVRVGYTSKGK